MRRNAFWTRPGGMFECASPPPAFAFVIVMPVEAAVMVAVVPDWLADVMPSPVRPLLPLDGAFVTWVCCGSVSVLSCL